MFDSAENHQDLETGKKIESFFTERLTFSNGDEENISYFKFILGTLFFETQISLVENFFILKS
jgi:hypothetical protein